MTKPKQIVFIMTDSQRFDMLSCYRKTGLLTSCLDQLAADGCRFDKAYTTQPVCQPARAALFFGQYPHEVNSWTNSSGVADNAHSIGERLQKHDIHTAYIGKWHLDGGDYFGLGKCPDGWDPAYWYDMKNYLDELTPEDRQRSRITETNQEGIDASFTFAHRCSDKAIHFLNQHHQEDFFLVVSYDEPHGPFLCPEPYASMYEDYEFPVSDNVYDTLENKPEHQKVWAGSSNQRSKPVTIKAPAYFGCNHFVDSEIGRVTASVREKAPDALMIYTSDHGDFLSSHGLTGKGPAAYEEIAHIPLIISGPGIQAGSSDAAPISHIDLPPTLFAAMGLPVPAIFSGRNLWPELTSVNPRQSEPIFIEFGRYEVDHDGFGGFQPMRAGYDGRYKLVINLLWTDELYDLEKDPGECRNLINDKKTASIRDQLHDAILGYMNQTRDPFRGYMWERRPWREDARPASWDYTLMTRQREDEDFECRQLDYATGLPMKKAVREKE